MTTPREDAIECIADEYEALAEQLHESIVKGQSVSETAKLLRILADRASLDEGEAMVREMEANALEQKLSGHWVDLASPEAAEALARAVVRTVNDGYLRVTRMGAAAAILAAWRETGR